MMRIEFDSVEELKSLCEYFGVQISYFKGDSEEKESTKEKEDIYITNSTNTPKVYISISDNLDTKEKEINKEKEKSEKKAERKQRREERKYGKNAYGKFKNVFLTDEELEKFQKEYPDWESKIEALSLGIASKGYNYKNHYATLLNWAKMDRVRNGQQPKRRESWTEIAEQLSQEMDLPLQ